MINLNPPVTPMQQRHRGRDLSRLPLDDDVRVGRCAGANGVAKLGDDLVVSTFEPRLDLVADRHVPLLEPRQIGTVSSLKSQERFGNTPLSTSEIRPPTRLLAAAALSLIASSAAAQTSSQGYFPADPNPAASFDPLKELPYQKLALIWGLEETLSISHLCAFAIDRAKLDAYMTEGEINTPVLRQVLSDGVDLKHYMKNRSVSDSECTLGLFAAISAGIVSTYPDGKLMADMPLNSPPFRLKK